MGFNPVEIDALARLTMGAHLSGNIWSLHARLRYFDPEKRRAGLPRDVAALVEKLEADQVTVTLVNVNNVEPRSVILQAGAYAEHQFLPSGSSRMRVELAPGAGQRLTLRMKRYANAPTLEFPF